MPHTGESLWLSLFEEGCLNGAPATARELAVPVAFPSRAFMRGTATVIEVTDGCDCRWWDDAYFDE